MLHLNKSKSRFPPRVSLPYFTIDKLNCKKKNLINLNKRGVEMKKMLVLFSAFVLVAGAGAPAVADVTGYVDNPETNSINWQADVEVLGGIVNTDFNFESQSAEGLTMTIEPADSAVVNGQGPGQGNAWSEPVSEGEGLHAASNYLLVEGGPVSLTLTFTTPVYGAGLFVIDYFDPWGMAPLTISAYAADGSLLGSYSSVQFNFQTDKQYFMGVTSSDGDIASLVLTADTTATSDLIGIDDIRFAAAEPAEEPELTGDSLLQFFDDAVAAGTLQGNSRHRWYGKIRLWLTRKTLSSAVKAVERDRTRKACSLLKRVYRRCDGVSRPKDFVVGESAAELADMIEAFKATLDCESQPIHARYKRWRW